MSIRSAASCCHPRQEISVPRGARTVRGPDTPDTEGEEGVAMVMPGILAERAGAVAAPARPSPRNQLNSRGRKVELMFTIRSVCRAVKCSMHSSPV